MADSSKVAVVTGANRGIGLEIARQLAKKGLTVVGTARNIEDARKATKDIAGGKVICHELDVADQASVDALADFIRNELGRVDILVNNAGIYIDGQQRVTNADLAIVQKTFETNLFGAWRMAKALIPMMKQGGYGRIVNVSSGMGQFQSLDGGTPAYRMSKTAMNSLTRMMAVELKGTNILVNSADPGWVRTDMGSSAAPRSVEEGADTPVWLATLPDGGPTGGFFFDRKPEDW
ncbi:MAG TPA: SDR family oxidoreductase [Blastocatellia bacterium]|nr:SDR family oxidoreductase [Blastocatellia bacterium]